MNAPKFPTSEIVGIGTETDWTDGENRVRLLIYKVGLTLDTIRHAFQTGESLSNRFVDDFICSQTGLSRERLQMLLEHAEDELQDFPDLYDFLDVFANKIDKVTDFLAEKTGVNPDDLLGMFDESETQTNNEIDELEHLFRLPTDKK